MKFCKSPLLHFQNIRMFAKHVNYKNWKPGVYKNLHGAAILNWILTNVPLMEKAGSWYLPAKCVKNTC